jgi:transposase
MAMRQREDSPEMFPDAAGIDVGGSSHWVAVPPGRADEPVREFRTMTDDLHAMADWLLACAVVCSTLVGERQRHGMHRY